MSTPRNRGDPSASTFAFLKEVPPSCSLWFGAGELTPLWTFSTESPSPELWSPGDSPSQTPALAFLVEPQRSNCGGRSSVGTTGSSPNAAETLDLTSTHARHREDWPSSTLDGVVSFSRVNTPRSAVMVSRTFSWSPRRLSHPPWVQMDHETTSFLHGGSGRRTTHQPLGVVSPAHGPSYPGCRRGSPRWNPSQVIP